MQRPTDFFAKEARSTSVGGNGGATCTKADALRESRAQVRVYLTPEVDGALQDKWLDTAHGPDAVADQVVAVRRRHDVPVQVACLEEVIVLRVQRVGVPDHFSRLHKPARIALAGIGFGSAVAVRCVH